MNLKKHEKTKRTILYVSIISAVAGILIIYILSNSIIITVVASTIFLILITMNIIQSYLDDKFISEIISDLSKLIDNLIELENNEIFPNNEDTLLSKLQNKVIKLSQILKTQKNKAVTDQENIKSLVSDISHQLKTPIANIKMYTEFLSNDNLSQNQRKEYVSIIKISVDRLNFLSENMIKISRLESGIINLKIESRSLNSTVLKSIKDIFAKAKNKNIEIVFNASQEIETNHDYNWTAEAIFNILDNAVKYSPSGSVITVKIKKYGMFCAVSISDNAQKITEDESSKIFNRFYRGKNSQNSEGIGIGLYLAREIAIKQGGYITLKNHQIGNTFLVFLPIWPNNNPINKKLLIV